MTGYSIEQLVAQALDNGAACVLYKPFQISDLLNALVKARPRGLVLVADDDSDFAESASDILIASGYRVDIARTGREAMHKLRAKKIDCLILDLRLPIMSGIEVFIELRASHLTVPTILVTAFHDDVAQARRTFSDETLLTKPFEPAALLAAIEAEMEAQHGADAA
jgi:DNA-binding response OmpR family regulator